MMLYPFSVRLLEVARPGPNTPPPITAEQHLEALRKGGNDYKAAKATRPKGK